MTPRFALLARIEAYGLTDLLKEKWEPSGEQCRCTFGEACRHTRTRIDPRDKDNPLQVDYLFASDGLIANPYVCGTLDQEEWAEYSDHAPIIATF